MAFYVFLFFATEVFMAFTAVYLGLVEPLIARYTSARIAELFVWGSVGASAVTIGVVSVEEAKVWNEDQRRRSEEMRAMKLAEWERERREKKPQ